MSSGEPVAIIDCRPNLLVSDLNASLRFYADALGFRVGWQWSDRQTRFLPEGERVDPGEPGTALVGRDNAQIILTRRRRLTTPPRRPHK
jgi:catechol 2,3-dioxygenase-like lactoylglutathione lyase family enzyme